MKKSLIVSSFMIYATIIAQQPAKNDLVKKDQSPNKGIAASEKKGDSSQKSATLSQNKKDQSNLPSWLRYVDSPKVFENTFQGEEFKRAVTQDGKARQEEFQKEMLELEKEKSEFSKKVATLNEETIRKERKRLTQKETDLETRTKESGEEFQLAIRKKNEELALEFQSIVDVYREEKGLGVICDAQTGQVLSMDPALKCTDDIIVSMNKHYKGPLKKDGDSSSAGAKNKSLLTT